MKHTDGSAQTIVRAATLRQKHPICYHSQLQYAEVVQTNPSADPITPGVWQGSLLVCCLFVGCLTSQQQASLSQGRICSDNYTCCHTETEVADQTFYLTQSQYTNIGQTSPSADPIPPEPCRVVPGVPIFKSLV